MNNNEYKIMNLRKHRPSIIYKDEENLEEKLISSFEKGEIDFGNSRTDFVKKYRTLRSAI